MTLEQKNFKGFFITLEGMECSGKTTQIKNIIDKYNKDIILTREPGGTDLSEQIRGLIMNNNMSTTTEAYLFASARSEHMNNKIIPALEEGKIVISDRFLDTSIVYQGIIKKLGIETVMDINKNAIKGYLPDITIFIDITVDEMYNRISSRKEEEKNRFDNEIRIFHEKARDGYHKIAKIFPERFIIIDGMLSCDEIFENIIRIIENHPKYKLLGGI